MQIRLMSSLLAASLLALSVYPSPLFAEGQTLAPCPRTPNCVSTEASSESQRMPTVPFTDSPSLAQARASAALLAEPRSSVVSQQTGYVHGECRSLLLFRFVDDVEIVVDSSAHVFRFRSASRVGRSDMGVNRLRMTRISDRLRTASSPAPASR